jgi:hypothetical protein
MKKLVIFLILSIVVIGCSKENKVERVSKVDSGTIAEVQTSQNQNNAEEKSQSQKVSSEKEKKVGAKSQKDNLDKKSSGTYTKELKSRMEKLEKEMQSKLDSGVTSEMVNANNELYEAWDKELNKVYKLLMEKLPADRKEKLKKDQRAWVKIKEEKANEAAKEADGGTLAGVLYSGTATGLTKDRAIELAKMYDNLK